MPIQDKAKIARLIDAECVHVRHLVARGELEEAVYEIQKTANWLRSEINRQEEARQEDQEDHSELFECQTGLVLTQQWGAV